MTEEIDFMKQMAPRHGFTHRVRADAKLRQAVNDMYRERGLPATCVAVVTGINDTPPEDRHANRKAANFLVFTCLRIEGFEGVYYDTSYFPIIGMSPKGRENWLNEQAHIARSRSAQVV